METGESTQIIETPTKIKSRKTWIINKEIIICLNKNEFLLIQKAQKSDTFI